MFDKKVLFLVAILTGIVGILRMTVVAFGHVAPLPLETIFFVFFGAVQIFLAVKLFSSGRLKYLLTAFIVNGGLVFLWALTRVYRATFTAWPEGIDALWVEQMELPF